MRALLALPFLCPLPLAAAPLPSPVDTDAPAQQLVAGFDEPRLVTATPPSPVLQLASAEIIVLAAPLAPGFEDPRLRPAPSLGPQTAPLTLLTVQSGAERRARELMLARASLIVHASETAPHRKTLAGFIALMILVLFIGPRAPTPASPRRRKI